MVILKQNFFTKLTLTSLLLVGVATFSPYQIPGTTTSVHAKISDDLELDDTFEDGTKIDKDKYGKGDLITNGINLKDDDINGKNAFKYLNKAYKGLFTQTKNLKGNDDASVHYKNYDAIDFRTVYYGGPSDAGYLQKNDYIGSQRRYIGVEYTRYEPTHNPSVSYDYCTDGTLLARRVLNRPTSNPDKIPVDNNVINNGSRQFNYDTGVQIFYTNMDSASAGKVNELKQMSGKEIRKEWATLIHDKYADDDVIALNRQQKHQWCYLRPKYGNMKANHIQLKFTNLTDRIDHFHVTVPPTELTDGQTYEWHNNNNYDGFRLSYKTNANFKAVKIKTSIVGSIVQATLEVQNTEKHYVGTGTSIPTAYVVSQGTDILISGRAPSIGPHWNDSETKEVAPLIPTYMLPDSALNKKLTIQANFNPDEGDTFYETNYVDNKITKDFTVGMKPGPDYNLTCNKSYFGSTRQYGLLETKPGTDELVCNIYSVTLADAVEVATATADHTTLTGVWSSNSRGHYKYKSEIAAKDVGQSGTLRATNTPQFSGQFVVNKKVTNFRVPGVQKLGRVIRAGRNVEMYSGIKLVITAQSFNSSGAAESAVDRMYNYMMGKTDKNKFVNRGDRVVGNTVKGQLKNNLKKVETPAQVDGHRSAKVENTSKSTTKYGNCDVKQTVYEVRKEYFVPFATKNVGGKQATQNGDFAPTKDYSVDSNAYKYFTNIDNPDGIYNLYFRNYIAPSIFEGVGASETYCDTTPEKFIIQGNLYDDVRTEDKTTKDTVKDLSW